MAEQNYFSWYNYRELADIDSHINYAHTLLNKYEWGTVAKRKIENQLGIIEQKQNDKLLNLSVIGEFSTGKSSFINALVGYELLAVNVIQGTTVAITIIEYGEEFSITIVGFDGVSTKKSYTSIDTLRQYLHQYTTDPEYGREINYLQVTLPSQILKRGFRIIDTPGTNSLELWHEDVTKKAITELSDLSIITIDATKPMPETLMAFIDSTLETSIKDSVFVVNKIDLVKERERSGIIKYTSTKAAQRFDIDNPVVFPFSSVSLTNTFSKEKVAVDDNSFLLSTQSLDGLLNYTARQRVKAQARKTLLLIDSMYTSLDNDIKKIEKKYDAQIKKLELSKKTDLKPFITNQITLRQKRFLSEAKEAKYVVESTGDTLIAESIDKINSKIDSCGNLDNLSEYIKGNLASDIKDEGQTISNGIEAKFSALNRAFNSEMYAFQKEFETEFEKLKILAVKLNVQPKTVSVKHSSNSANIGPITALITKELSKENWAFFGGMGAGAAIGTAIFPVVGTIIGGIIGLGLGSAAAPDKNEVISDVKSKLSTPLNSYYRSVANDCLSNYNRYMSDINSQIESEINRYLATYNETVLKEIEQWNVKYHTVRLKIEEVQTEKNNIKNRQEKIKNLITTI